MNPFSQFVLAFVHVLVVKSVHIDYDDGNASQHKSWCYGGNECGQESSSSGWNSGICKNGQHQSPINIDTDQLVKSHSSLNKGNVIITEEMRQSYDITNFFLSTANKTIQLDTFVTATGEDAMFKWGDSMYKLNRAQFTWGPSNNLGSEHAIDGEKYAGELQLIHYKVTEKGGGMRDAFYSENQDAFAVISFLLEAYNEEENVKKSRRKRFVDAVNSAIKGKNKKSKEKEPAYKSAYASLEPVIYGLERLDTKNGSMETVKVRRTIKFNDFFKGQKKAFAYLGSLTTPGCQEIVTWLICENPVKVKVTHLQALRDGGRDEDGGKLTSNFRKLQSNKAQDGSRRPVKRISILEEEKS